MEEERILAMLPDVINGKTQAELMEELRTSVHIKNSHVLNGIKFSNWVMPRSNFDALKTFEVRDDDIYHIAYPKSGSHWIAEILHFIINDGRDDFDRSFMRTGLEVTQELTVDNSTPGYKVYELMESPRCMGSHCYASLMPPNLWKSQAKVIYLARNPKDTFVSFFNFMRPWFQPSFQTWDAFFFMLFSGEMLGGSWFDHVLGYWERRNDENVLFLKYESMHKDLRGCISKTAKHVGKDLPDDVIDSIVERVTFGEMQKTYKRIQDTNGKQWTHMGPAPFLRKGKVGNWKTYFTVAQSALFDMVYAEKLKGTGLDFDFDI